MDRPDQILEIKIVAILQRNPDGLDEDFQKKINTDNWEHPVLEVICRGNL